MERVCQDGTTSSHYMDPPMSSSSGGPTYEDMAKK
ncbi:hypothetical protein F442_16502 [Phytophthora nicotianae P10297]|uniref:Uncharacterized protein n=1 Tax=Phytophthora nicotianae P10297 TaxID=1317064 RepID=W2YJQ7_PHYNI|nr:hypothetical protein F442_16502 [Phytophthora nicotianae P10297]